MTQRIVLVLGLDFLRVLVRQLLRRRTDVEIVGEFESLAAAAAARNATRIIVDSAACDAEPAALPDLGKRYPGRIILVGPGHTVPLPRGLRLSDVTLVPAGSATAQFDVPAVTARMDAALSRPAAQHPARPPAAATPVPVEAPEVPLPVVSRARRPALIAIAASTGGPEALQEFLYYLDTPVCPIVIALHIPGEHTGGMAAHLKATTGHKVAVGQAGPLRDNPVVLLQGGVDHVVTRSADEFWILPAKGSESPFHPNGTVLLTSVAELDRPVVGIVMTGMGDDGCAGAQSLAARGYPVLAQDPATCAVPGMPNAAIAAGAVTEVAPLKAIAARLNGWFALPD
jgi:two-component system, chemotaxis family, protein-glutamate methylesterase/glutaminase